MNQDNATLAAGSSAPACSARWRITGKIEWTPLRDWHQAFTRAWWIGGQIGEYANDAYTVGVRICGLFVAAWWYLPNAHALAEERSDDSQQRVVGGKVDR